MLIFNKYIKHLFTIYLLGLCLSIIFLTTGCSKKQYSFTIDAPPKYSSEYVFKRMQIRPFQSNRRQYGNTIVTLIKSGVAREGYIKVVQNKADSVLTGVIKIGNIYKDSRSKSYKCTRYNGKKKYETTCYTYYYDKKVLIKADYTLHSSVGDNVVLCDSVAYDFNQTWSSSESRSEARARAWTDDQIIESAMSTIASQIIHAITPHKETVSRELQEGSDDSVELGIKYLRNGRIDQAILIWDQCINGSTSIEDKAAAYYNIGIVKESQGFYRDAFELYSKANALLPEEELYMQSMTRAETLKQRDGELKNWTN